MYRPITQTPQKVRSNVRALKLQCNRNISRFI